MLYNAEKDDLLDCRIASAHSQILFDVKYDYGYT